jgi:hypothetical protein
LYSVSVVPTPAGYTGVGATSINNLGQVAGLAGGPGNTSAFFIATGSNAVAVAIPSGFTPINNVFLNDAGQIAGTVESSSFSAYAAYIGNAAGVSLVGTPTPNATFVGGLDNAGTFVGTSLQGGVAQAFTGTSSGITPLPYSFGDAINNLGQVLVQAVSGPTNQNFILTGTNAVPIGADQLGQGIAINDNDQVLVGQGAVGPLFLVTTSGTTMLPAIPGIGFMTGVLNDQGVAAGEAFDASSTAYGWVWDPLNGTRLLSTLVPAGWNIQDALAINNSGEIVALASFMGAPSESIVLIPVPEPSTISMMLATIALFATIHFAPRRRSSE